jgi:hypothetical protein
MDILYIDYSSIIASWIAISAFLTFTHKKLQSFIIAHISCILLSYPQINAKNSSLKDQIAVYYSQALSLD